MAFPSRELLRLSLDALRSGNFSPLALVSIPCMLSAGITTVDPASGDDDKCIRFGSPNERDWLDKYFRLPGGPSGKPYYMPATGEWVQERYPDRSLQRRRKDFEDSIFYHPSSDKWALRPGAAQVAARRLLQEPTKTIPLVALMVWMWRDRDLNTLPEALGQFITAGRFAEHGFVGTLYNDDIPAAFLAAGLSDQSISPEELAELTGAVPPAPTAPPVREFIVALEGILEANHFRAPKGLVERVVGGWMVGDIVVLVGSTGSGKSTLAHLLAKGLESIFGQERFYATFLEITPQYDPAQFLGYENLAGEFTRGSFADEVLFVGTPSDPRLVVLDEWNLAQIDSYFAPVLTAVESSVPLHLPGRLNLAALSADERDALLLAQPDIAEGRWRLPEDTFFLATCNSWQEEPESRRPISGPVKRRCRIIPMPNILESVLADGGREGLAAFGEKLISQERDRVVARGGAGRESVFDSHRRERLAKVANLDALPEKTRDTLLTLAQILLQNPQTKGGFTPGILRDLVLSCVYALEGAEHDALGQEIADKVLHQLRGDPQILRVIGDQVRDFSNRAEIMDLIKRMGGSGTERKIVPLV